MIFEDVEKDFPGTISGYIVMGSRCPSCNRELLGFEVFCPSCGYRVKGGGLGLFHKIWFVISRPGRVAAVILPNEGFASTLGALMLLALFPALGTL